MSTQQIAELKLQCLEVVIANCDPMPIEDAIKAAEKIYDFVKPF